MNKNISYRGFRIKIQQVELNPREHIYDVYKYGYGPSIWGNSFSNPYYLMRKFKKGIDNYIDQPESEREFLQ